MKVPRIAFLSAASSSTVSLRRDALRQGLRELGYTEGKNIFIEYRYSDGRPDRLNQLAADLAGLEVNVIVTGGPTATRAASKATATIPIVMAFDDDPVGSGFVASLARPAGNITGLAALYPEISGKQLELLKEVVPKLSRVAILGSSTHPGTSQSLKELDVAAAALGLQLQFLDVAGSKRMDDVLRAAVHGRAEAVLALASPILLTRRKQIAEFAAKNRIPAIYPWPELLEDGGLMTYGVSMTDMFHRAATYVDRILKGARPSDLPVEQPKKFELLINLKTARQIGLTIPPNVLARADRIIK